jgi:Leucine-rich repeat (LRR) protein
LTPDALAALSTLPNLIRLHIEDAPSASNWFECAMAHKALRRLTLCRTGLSDNALPRLLELHELRDLDLGYNDLLSSQALGTLSQNLRRLCLHGTRADDATVEALCSLPNLESLELDHCPITDASATRILALPTIRDASAHECEHVCLEAKSSLRRLSGTSW